MKYRTAFFSCLTAVLLSSVALAGCDDGMEHDHDGHHSNSSQIVFGIDQTKGADGKATTSVGYEMLDVLSHGSQAHGIVNKDESCWVERLDDRLGTPMVEGGVATFTGGLLPANGVAVVANRSADLTLPGAAWANSGDTLTFQSKGFAMPDVDAQSLVVPSQDLAITSPADATAAVAVTQDQELTIGWTAGTKDENVVASLTAATDSAPTGRGVELRCFFDRSTGTGKFPKDLMTRFAVLVSDGTPNASAPPIKGKLRFATHRQLTIFARGGWTVYVVATAEQREQPFTLPR